MILVIHKIYAHVISYAFLYTVWFGDQILYDFTWLSNTCLDSHLLTICVCYESRKLGWFECPDHFLNSRSTFKLSSMAECPKKIQKMYRIKEGIGASVGWSRIQITLVEGLQKTFEHWYLFPTFMFFFNFLTDNILQSIK